MKQPNPPTGESAELRRRAELSLRGHPTKSAAKLTPADSQRQLHELEVHQIELELQNAELQKTRDELELALEKYTDLYDFAPVSYFTLGANGIIQMANLTATVLIGIERSRLVGRPFGLLLSAEARPAFNSFLKQVFANQSKLSRDFELVRKDQAPRIVNIDAQRLFNRPECRIAVTDITERKRIEATQRRLEVLAASNRKLEQEIARRQVVEQSLQKSQQAQTQLLKQSQLLQGQLRHLSRQLLSAQEEERKRISRELHDVIAQTLTSIHVRLAALTTAKVFDAKYLKKTISGAQRLLEESVEVVHRFARELRPTVLDDLGLIPALHSFVKTFAKESHLHVHLKVFAGVEQLDAGKRTVLYRVAQEALTNVARHARASRVDISIEKQPRAVALTIKDNGKSFPVQRVFGVKATKRLGLLGMRERMEMVGGTFRIESVPGQGTTIHAEIPLTTGRGGGGGPENSPVKPLPDLNFK